MKRSIAMAALVGALACSNGSDTAAPVSAVAPEEGRRLVEEDPGTSKRATPVKSPEVASSSQASVTTCLGLVQDSRFVEAVEPCTRALRDAPGNREVADALAKAKEEVAQESMAKAAAAAKDAAGGASDAAEGASSSLLDEQRESIPKGLR